MEHVVPLVELQASPYIEIYEDVEKRGCPAVAITSMMTCAELAREEALGECLAGYPYYPEEHHMHRCATIIRVRSTHSTPFAFMIGHGSK